MRMQGCRCRCTCKPDSISLFWMNDNHTLIPLKGKNLGEIVDHAIECHKNDRYGMLCSPHLMLEDGELYRIGENIHGGDKFHKDINKWILSIMNDENAMELIEKGRLYGYMDDSRSNKR